MAPQKITFGRKNTVTPEEREATLRGADPGNNYIWGLQNPGEVTSASRSPKYGNPNMLPKQATPQVDNNNNQIVSIPQEQTGLLGEFSSTMNPQQSPEMMGQSAEQRMKMIAAGHQPPGLNNRQQIYGA
tara:strand:+ start:136 stop:522 length:387 start_codon:yes stop_codon:yes gene_type:complete